MPDTPLDFDQLEYEGYTIVHGFMDRARTQRIRDHMDSLLPPIGASREDPKRWHHVLRHPIPGAIMAELLTDPTLLALAARSLKARELRLLEQVLIRSDPRPPPHMPLGWHIDFAFFPRQHQALPRQTYFHMVHCLNTVAPGGAAFMVVPGSHQLTYAISAQMETAEELSRLKRDPVGLTGIEVKRESRYVLRRATCWSSTQWPCILAPATLRTSRATSISRRFSIPRPANYGKRCAKRNTAMVSAANCIPNCQRICVLCWSGKPKRRHHSSVWARSLVTWRTSLNICRLPAVRPPSTARLWPVIHAASSEARKSAARATSSGWPTRPSGYH